ncbi:MAG: hypothetical protein Q8P67_05855 [archaeon]|nr:hypothetical protein [archaeon]
MHNKLTLLADGNFTNVRSWGVEDRQDGSEVGEGTWKVVDDDVVFKHTGGLLSGKTRRDRVGYFAPGSAYVDKWIRVEQ